MNITVVTALLGPAESPPAPGPAEPGTRYVCFTDRIADGWECRPAPMLFNSPRLGARHVKTNLDELLPNTDWSVWLDASFDLQVRPSRLVAFVQAMGAEVGAFIHPDRATVDAEAAEVVRLKLADVRAVQAQLAYMRRLGFDTGKERLLTTTGLMVRRHSKAVARFNSLWWGQIASHTLRDQLSVDFAAYRAGIAIGHLPGSYRDNDFARYDRVRHRAGRIAA